MKSMKLMVAVVALALASFGASAQNKFVTDQLDGNSAANGAKTVNIADVREVELVGTTVVIFKKNGTTDNWAGGWAIFDRFVAGGRSSGADFVYYQEAASGKHRKVNYAAVAETTCTNIGGANQYQVTAKFDVESGSGTLVFASYTANVCNNFN